MIGETMDNNLLGADNVNLISFVGSSSGVVGGAMAVDPVYYGQTCSAGNELGRIFTEIDFIVFSGITSPSLEDEKDIREIFTHELGHAHMLTHAKSGSTSFQYLMHPNGNGTGTISASDEMGADLVFPNSLSIVDNSCGYAIGQGFCGEECIMTSIDEVAGIRPTLNVYPNPTSANVSISLEGTRRAGTLTITDIYGRKIAEQKVALPLREYLVSLPSVSGVYFVHIDTGSLIVSEKIIKL